MLKFEKLTGYGFLVSGENRCLLSPGRFGGRGAVVEIAGKDEEVVAEAVDVVEYDGCDSGSRVGEG